MIKITESFALGNYIFEFNVTLSDDTNVPYQLTFERDLYFDRTNVTLLNLFAVEDNQFFCPELREAICECFYKFFEHCPEEKVYFEQELAHARNLTKFYKFYRWSLLHKNEFEFRFEVVDKDDILYSHITIVKK